MNRNERSWSLYRTDKAYARACTRKAQALMICGMTKSGSCANKAAHLVVAASEGDINAQQAIFNCLLKVKTEYHKM